jgi:hypothetical protein
VNFLVSVQGEASLLLWDRIAPIHQSLDRFDRPGAHALVDLGHLLRLGFEFRVRTSILFKPPELPMAKVIYRRLARKRWPPLGALGLMAVRYRSGNTKGSRINPSETSGSNLASVLGLRRNSTFFFTFQVPGRDLRVLGKKGLMRSYDLCI